MTAKDQARSRIAAAAGQLLELSHRIHAHPETAWAEHLAAGWLTGALDRLGYAVTRGACQLPTAFTASIGTGDLHIGICAEYDALPGLGHACGHNIIAAAAIGAATGLAGVAGQLGLTVTVLGTPAEEGGGGKILLLDRGAFDGLHAAMMIHPGPADAARAEPFAVDHQHISYRGATAHAAAYPELGVNAADAFTIAQVAIGLLRQQLPASARVHGIVTHAGLAPNAIPGRAEGRWYVRAGSLAELDRIEPRVRACFQAGALATGCELTIKPESPRYAEFRTDEQLLGLFLANARDLGRPFTDPGAGARMNRASTDMGNISLRLPAIHPYLGIDSLPAVNHQPEFAAHCTGPAADRAVLDGAIALAATVIDAATRDNVRDRLLHPPGPPTPITLPEHAQATASRRPQPGGAARDAVRAGQSRAAPPRPHHRREDRQIAQQQALTATDRTMLNTAAVLPCASVAAATQNTVATVLRYRSMTSSGDGIASFAETAGGTSAGVLSRTCMHR